MHTKPLLKLPLYLALCACLAFMLVPLAYLVCAGCKNGQDLLTYTFLPPPERMSTENIERVLGSSALSTTEVRDWRGLCRKLAAGAATPGPARRVMALLPPGAAAIVNRTATGVGPLPWEDQETLRAGLNHVLQSAEFHSAEDFAHITFSHEMRELLRQHQSGAAVDLGRLNRLLLEAAFPQEIERTLLRVDFVRYLMNSFFIAGTIVMIQLFTSSLGGFALAKYDFRGKRLVMLCMLGTMMIPGQVLLAPLYELVGHLGLMDSLFGLVVPATVSVFGMFLFRQAMLGVPDELLEAGRLDGCSEFRLYWNIVVPVTRPMIGAFCLMAFMAQWNSFLWPQLILHSRANFTLPVGLNQMLSAYSQAYGVMLAGTLLAILPVVVLFFVLQKEFISGLTSGAVKG